jgi:hypothetical protein
VQFASQLLDSRLDHRPVDAVDLRRRGRIAYDPKRKTLWWMWPWDPDDGLRRPASAHDPLHPQWLRWLSSKEDNPKGELQVVLARAPRAPDQWLAQLTAALHAKTQRADLHVRLHGPVELARECEGVESALDLDHFRLPWALAARDYDYSACERALIDALDRGVDAREHWTVVADELLRRGDPTGESLALALAAMRERPSRKRKLEQVLVERETARMLGVDRHAQMLAFVDTRGRSFDAVSFLTDTRDAPEPERYEVQLWAERVGPFFVRLLARTNYDEWIGVGLPESLLSAPELRYLSATRMSSIHAKCADISGRDLSGFDFSSLPATGGHIHAYEASLRGCDLRQADLSYWQLDGADLREAEADLHTRFTHASLVETRVSVELQQLISSWNAGRHYNRRNRWSGPADARELVIE